MTDLLAAEAAKMQEQVTLAQEMLAANPTLGQMSALIIAGDMVGAKRWRAEMDTDPRLTPERVFRIVGSYARVGFALDLVDEGLLPRETLIEALPNLWSFSDPDDTDPRFLALWKEAWEANGRQVLLDPADGPGLPEGDLLTVYRGQDRGDTFGIAWSLDRGTAEKFARGAALRQAYRDGEVLVRKAPRDKVMGYLTARGEAEVVIDPADLTE